MKHWKRQAKALQARLERAEYHFDVVWTYDDGTQSRCDNVAVVDGTLDVGMFPNVEDPDRRVVAARVLVKKVVDGMLVSVSPSE